MHARTYTQTHTRFFFNWLPGNKQRRAITLLRKKGNNCAWQKSTTSLAPLEDRQPTAGVVFFSTDLSLTGHCSDTGKDKEMLWSAVYCCTRIQSRKPRINLKLRALNGCWSICMCVCVCLCEVLHNRGQKGSFAATLQMSLIYPWTPPTSFPALFSSSVLHSFLYFSLLIPLILQLLCSSCHPSSFSAHLVCFSATFHAPFFLLSFRWFIVVLTASKIFHSRPTMHHNILCRMLL